VCCSMWSEGLRTPAGDLHMGHANVIWQGDANSVCLRALAHCQSPPFLLNLTGPETVPCAGWPALWASASESSRCSRVKRAGGAAEQRRTLHRLFGYPSVSIEQMIEWVAHWIGMGGAHHEQPTHFLKPRTENSDAMA